MGYDFCLQDPVDSSPAVLVKRFNMTQQKELELQLSIQQEVLQRKNQEMEQDSAALQQEKERLESEAAELAMRLDAVMRDKFAHSPTGFDADTPIDKTLNLLHGIIAGQQPQVQAAMDLYHILSESDTPLRQPVALETQLLAEHLDDDVGRSMLQLLQGNHSRRALEEELSRSVSKGTGGNWGLVQGAVGGLSSQDAATSYVPQNVTPVIERMLQDAENNWHFDVFGFDEECKGKGLSVLAFHLYKQAGFIRDFKLYDVKLINFLQKAESGYSSANPYHNSIHATSVLQMTHMLLHHGGVLKSRAVSKAQYMSSYWSAITHDYEHGGLNNDFLIKTAHPLAIRYNDQSPLENHHVAAAAGLLFQDEYQFIKFAALKSETIMQVRVCCINQAAFKRPDANSLNKGAVEEALEWDKMLVKCADIGHLAAAPRIHKRWATLLEDEFFIQGDKEKAAGLPVSPLMDRSMKGGMTRSQLGFFNIVGIPLFKSFTELFPEAQPMLDGVLDNFKHWELGTAMEDLPP
ncbi:putative 3',5'-cyclic phosphodiesterase pde-3 [Trebouxia sp. C0009 RCD-2024]